MPATRSPGSVSSTSARSSAATAPTTPPPRPSSGSCAPLSRRSARSVRASGCSVRAVTSLRCCGVWRSPLSGSGSRGRATTAGPRRRPSSRRAQSWWRCPRRGPQRAEVDLVAERPDAAVLVEAKATATPSASLLAGAARVRNHLAESYATTDVICVYGGDMSQQRRDGRLVPGTGSITPTSAHSCCRCEALCFPLLFAALTGRSGHGLASDVVCRLRFAAYPLGL